MQEHQVVVVALFSRDLPARIAGLLLPHDIEMVGMQFNRSEDDGFWWIHLSVRTKSDERLEFLTKRLNRLIDVQRVVVLEQDCPRRQSVYVRLNPDAADLKQIWSLVTRFDAEVLDIDEAGTMLHLNASPDRCVNFISMLRPHNIIEVVASAISAARPQARISRGGAQRTAAVRARA
ncbi:hypothetical protein [Rhodococcus sp. ACS1]|uniref:hypothetical protein n=1 Tax=Rhodococcus sp. ACS1 TaxID=2028570 RepID=UPI00117B2F94|nr:hypothetical protein [Rhodococcus sp. ACS1]